MFGILRRRRERQEAEHQAWVAKWQDIFDPALHQRVIDATDKALAGASRVDVGVYGDTNHTSAWWTWRHPGDTSAQRTIHPTGVNYQIFIEAEDRPDDGPWVLTSTQAADWDEFQVRWMPGQGVKTVEQFLDWFEEETA